MLYEESLWFKTAIRTYVPDDALAVNIGSSSKQFVEHDQPYIKTNVLDELRAKRCVVKNIDLKPYDGVDLVGDVTDPSFVDSIAALSPGAIICSNLLEHIENRTAFCEGLAGMVKRSTVLMVSVPRSFPYHEDPIDTMYRPSVIDLQQAFPDLSLVEGDVIDCGIYYWYASRYLSPVVRWLNLFRVAVLFVVTKWGNPGKHDKFAWSFRRMSATCLVLRRSE